MMSFVLFGSVQLFTTTGIVYRDIPVRTVRYLHIMVHKVLRLESLPTPTLKLYYDDIWLATDRCIAHEVQDQTLQSTKNGMQALDWRIIYKQVRIVIDSPYLLDYY